jgi:dimeric dUTPase (all-alpha-NTP-PPase superfamily)
MKQKIIHMLEMQDAMNSKVNKDWRNAGFEWYRAVWMEASEMIEHYGWKWWKQQSPDIMQVKLEVVDIVHFCLSIRLVQSQVKNQSSAQSSDRPGSEIAEGIVADLQNPSSTEDIRTSIELLARETLVDKNAHFSIIAGIMGHLGMNFDELYEIYIGKNVLNVFRQDNGYNNGSYKKIWNGREDNECLAEILGILDSNSLSFKEDIYSALDEAYAA